MTFENIRESIGDVDFPARRCLQLMVVAMLVFQLAVLPVAAQEGANRGGGSDGGQDEFICTGGNGPAAGAGALAGTIQTVLTVAIGGGLIGGLLVAAGAQAAQAGSHKDDYEQMRNQALVGAFLVPIIIYGGGFLIGQLVAGGTACILP